MHDDERRDETALQKMILDDFVAHPEESSRKYLVLVERDRRARKREGRERQLEERERKLSGKVTSLEAENQDLTRRLASAHGALEAYRSETRRLKEDLRRVRSSRSMKIGRAVTQPASVFRRSAMSNAETPVAAENLAGTSPDAVAAEDHVRQSLSESPSGLPADRRVGNQEQKSPALVKASTGSKLWELTDEQLRERLEDAPTADVLAALLNRSWFQQGDISECERLLARHSDLVDSVPAKSKELISRVLGVARLRDGRITVPPRSHGAAYRVERGRVMYCAHSTPVFDSNGYSTRTRGLIEGLRSNGSDVTVVSRVGYPWDTHPKASPSPAARYVETLGGVDYVHIPGANINRDPLDTYILSAADAYVREAKIRRPEVFHAASNFRQAFPALIAARRVGVPFVYEVRGLWELTEAAAKDGWESSERFAMQVEFETLVAREADHVLVITEQVRAELIARGVDGARISLLPNAVNEAEFVPLPPDHAYAQSVGITLDRPVIGFAGSLVAYEGLDVLLESVRVLRDREVPVQLVIAGSGSAEEGLRKLAATLGIERDVKFLGRIPATDVPRLMSLMDVMPCPRLSTRVTEMVSPLKPLEALAVGKPVVLSDVAPHVDLVPRDGSRGMLVSPGDAGELADALTEILGDEERARGMAREGRLWVVRNRSWKVISDSLASIYNRAKSHSDRLLTNVPNRSLDTIRVGLIADEFTTETLSRRVTVVPISREDPVASLDEGIDLVFVESAWEGNGGEWFRGVGYYDDDEFAPLGRLLAEARRRGIPTVFWNKEDPVHYRRFVHAATRCDHVFTTDASLVRDYLVAGVDHVLSASSLPFYAELTLHNPVQDPASLGPSHAMYAGTYYGDRYKARSKELSTMLRAASAFGLTIYDRQYDRPDSPYQFPAEFKPQIRGSLPYSEVLKAYRSHFVNLNVNSVTESPTMFSRRVVEAAASGGVVLSGPGRGIDETFAGAIPASGDPFVQRALLRGWNSNPELRFDEAWFQLRAVARAHTTETALAILMRTAGIAVDGMHDIAYAAVLPSADETMVRSVLRQSVPTAALVVPSQYLGQAESIVEADGFVVPVVASADRSLSSSLGVGAAIRFEMPASRTFAEDLLTAQRFRGDSLVVAREFDAGDDARLLAAPLSDMPDSSERLTVGSLRLVDELDASSSLATQPTSTDSDTGSGLVVLVGSSSTATGCDSSPEVGVGVGAERTTVLFAGHDMKFLDSYMKELESQGHAVLVDEWSGHNVHDEARSQELLAQADVVWCEWGLGNAVWYSRHVKPSQTLVVRVHLQEIDLPYLRKVNTDAVDSFIFVGELIRRAAVESHGVPASRALVVPNFVNADRLALPKHPSARYTLGLVGIVPQRKRVDLAIELIERLHSVDGRYRLRIKGRRPEEYTWMVHRPDELRWYQDVYARIEKLNEEAGTEVVGFDEHGNDMPQWYQGIGTVVSTSDFESFHLTLADGAAAGSDAVSLAWDGADLIYPDSILYSTVETMADGVLDGDARIDRMRDMSEVVSTFDSAVVFQRFSELLLTSSNSAGQRP